MRRLAVALVVSGLCLVWNASRAGAQPAVIATVPVGSTTQAVAVNATTNRIYVTSQYGGNVSVIDGGSNTVVATVPVGGYPLGVAVNAGTKRIYVANGNSSSVSVIDGGTNTPVISVPLSSPYGPEMPYGVAVNATTNRIYVANQYGNNLSVINGASPEAGGEAAKGSGWSPAGYAVLASGLAAAVLATATGAWYARRRWLRRTA